MPDLDAIRARADTEALARIIRDALTRAPSLAAYYEALPEGVTSEAGAEARNLTRAGRDALHALLAEIERLREIIGDAVPALGSHARDFSQRALIAACEITGSDPADWTQHPDVLARLLAAQESAE